MGLRGSLFDGSKRTGAMALLLPFILSMSVAAQSQPSGTNVDAEKTLSLEQRIAQLEAEVRELKAVQSGNPAKGEPNPASVQELHQEPEAANDQRELRREAMDGPRGISFRGFGDVNFLAGGPSENNGFLLGNFNLLMTSRLSQDLSFLGELVMEGQDHAFTVRPERVLLQYRPNDYFHATLGRYHTGIGY